VLRVSNPITEESRSTMPPASRCPVRWSRIKDDLHRVAELGIDHVMWDLSRHTPYETRLRLLEPLIAVKPS